MMIIVNELFVPVVIIYFWNSFLPLQWNLIVQYIYLFVCLTKCELNSVLYCFFAWCYAIKKNSQFVKIKIYTTCVYMFVPFFPFCKCNWLCGKITANFVISCVELFSSVTVHFCWIFTKMHFSLLHYTIFFILHVSSTIWIVHCSYMNCNYV